MFLSIAFSKLALFPDDKINEKLNVLNQRKNVCVRARGKEKM